MSSQDRDLSAEMLLRYLRDRLADRDIGFGSDPERLLGGYDTDLYRFELEHSAKALPRSLVVRMYREYHGRDQPLMESIVQNCMAAAGCPAARVHLVCSDTSTLGQPFIIMDHLPGRVLISADPEFAAVTLAGAQADLHQVDSSPVVASLRERGIDNYWLSNRFFWLNHRALELPAVRGCVEWLARNRPSDPQRPAVCHGDFHLLNLLFAGEVVTGILDWSAFTLADPLFDVAGTLMLFSVHGRHLAGTGELPLSDVDLMMDRYLESYRSRRNFDEASLEFYIALRCVIALIHSLKRPGSRPPEIETALAHEILRISGVDVPINHQ